MSILSTASTALNAYQNALTVIGNNIANVNTAGYSRQTPQFTPGINQQLGNFYVGTGVQLADIYRNSNIYANQQLRTTTSIKSQFDIFSQQAAQVDSLLSQQGVDVSASLQNFFDALQKVNSAPDDMATRNAFMQQAQLLSSQFNYVQDQLNQYQNNNNLQLQDSLDQMNQLGEQVASLNKQLLSSPNSPDLLDQRDQLLSQLSTYADLRVTTQDSGVVNVSFSNGQTLVNGAISNKMTMSVDSADAFNPQIYVSSINVTNQFNSGSVKGLLDYEQTILGNTSQAVGQMAIGLSQAFNAQQNLGVDMNNALGQNFFTDFNSATLSASRSISSATNTGTATLSVNISDVSQLQLSDYQLVVTDATNHEYSLIRKSDGTSIPLTWDSSTSASPATLSAVSGGSTKIDGLTITVDNIANLAKGDQFTIAPTRGAAGQLNTIISDPRQLALAGAVRATAPTANTGTGNIVVGTVFNTSAVNNNYTITMDPTVPNQYTISGDPTTYTLVPNSNNTIYLPPGSTSSNASYSVVISGAPATGDTFTLGYNSGSVGDNRNGLLLAGVQQKDIFNGGTQSLTDAYSGLVADIGGQTNLAKLRANSADVIYNQALSYQTSISGVNLDEEATNLIKFQQAYQAAGKLLQVANNLMSYLFQVVG